MIYIEGVRLDGAGRFYVISLHTYQRATSFFFLFTLDLIERTVTSAMHMAAMISLSVLPICSRMRKKSMTYRKGQHKSPGVDITSSPGEPPNTFFSINYIYLVIAREF